MVGIGLIGTGFMGKCHALAYRAVSAVFADVAPPRLAVLCDTPADEAEAFARQFGFARATADWRDLVADPAVDLVAITTPNKLHREIALAAFAAGKHVYCEKPLGLTLAEAEEMATAAAAAGVVTQVGYNYLKNPAFLHAERLVSEGAIGRVLQFRGVVDEDYMADPALPWSWRCRAQEAGLGALGDMGCHLVSLAQALCGPIRSLCADMQTAYATRPMPDGAGEGPVENEDIATALVRFESGVSGMLTTSRVAWGRKGRLAFEIHGSAGMIAFDQERMNELRLFQAEPDRARHGSRTILSGPAHEPYGAFCPAPGHGLGFNDQKTIEVAGLLRAIAGEGRASPDFAQALSIERVIHAIADSARAGGSRVRLPG
ncbi:Gfo/Idh/MocA family oxidoreductase [Salinarimonas sp.]|uniref:Gfo/Idh/MocA family protein n=1 Tax=Salinarimonas sp. TaxID=2766526 RepID=UPI0032D96541